MNEKEREQMIEKATAMYRQFHKIMPTIPELMADFALSVVAGAPKWISIEERLPEVDGGYLTTYDRGNGTFAVAELYLHTRDYMPDEPTTRSWEAGGDGYPDDFPVIAWAELPPPYQPSPKGE